MTLVIWTCTKVPTRVKKSQRCTTCNFSSIRYADLKQHVLRNHTGEKPHKCDQCNYACTSSIDLQRHMRKHNLLRPFKCNQCNASFTCNNSLKRHAQTRIVTNDDKEEKPHKCTQCNNSANQANSLSKHILRHTGEKPHHCNHSGEKPHRCTTCEYFSIRYAHLKRHLLKYHTGEMPHKGDQCDYACVSSSELQSHMRKHIVLRPFKCTQCNASFKLNKSLMNHAQTHNVADNN